MNTDNGFWKVCAALDNPRRLRLLRFLLETNEFPCELEIAEKLKISAPVVSLYLKRLREVGLVMCQLDHRRMYYRAFTTDARGKKVLNTFRSFFSSKPSEQRIAELLEVTRALGHLRRNAYLRFLNESRDPCYSHAARVLSAPASTIDRLFNQLGHARLVDINGVPTRPLSEPEATLFDLTLEAST